MQPGPRVVQLARILGRDAGELDDAASARAAIDAHPDELASAFFHEAADSDDVTSVETALEYLEGRFAFFGDLVGAEAAARIRMRFGELVEQWED